VKTTNYFRTTAIYPLHIYHLASFYRFISEVRYILNHVRSYFKSKENFEIFKPLQIVRL